MAKKVLKPLILAFAVLLLQYLSSANNFLMNYSYDIFINLKTFAGRADNVVIIGIDGDAFEKYAISGSGTIPRRVYAELVEKAAWYDPAVLAFDVIFERRITSADDSRLISSLAGYPGPVVMSSTFQSSTGPGAGENYIEPWKEIADSRVSHGYVNIFRGIRNDFDSIRRLYLPYAEFAGKKVLSLPLTVAEKFGRIVIDESASEVIFQREIPKTATTTVKLNKGFAFINYCGDLDNFSVIPLSEFLDASPAQKEIYKKIIAGRVLLVGVINPIYRDIQDIPAMAFSLIPKRKQEYGVVILANIIENLLSNDVIQAVPAGVEVAAIFCGNFAFAGLMTLANPLGGLLALILLLFLLLFLSFYLFFSQGMLLNYFLMAAGLLLIFVISSFSRYYQVRRERQSLYAVLQKYVSPEVAKLITRSEYEKTMHGEKRVVTVVFADIRGFTQMSEKMDPSVISNILNEYFNRMTEIIFKNGGTIDKFIGDAIMIIFGAPVTQPDSAFRAVKTAHEMRLALKDMRRSLEENSERAFHIGIGINTGEAFVGNLGSDNHKEYTALGDTVNIAARLESRALPGQILFTEHVLREVESMISCNRLEPVVLKGKSRPQEIFELIDVIPEKAK